MRENRQGKALDAFDRNYRDPNHKPELLCALTPFWALKGFRRAEAIADTFQQLRIGELRLETAALLAERSAAGIRRFFLALLSLDADRRRRALGEAAAEARRNARAEPAFDWIVRLHSRYPSDIGALAPALLNLVQLGPGEGLFLPAGEPHAYLEGVGIELMANSDNVLRGGLTDKHIDIRELARVLRFEPADVEILLPEPRGGERIFQTPAEEFELAIVEPRAGKPYRGPAERGAHIWLCVRGEGRIESERSDERLEFRKGDSLLAPAAAGACRIDGDAKLFRAAVAGERLPGSIPSKQSFDKA